MSSLVVRTESVIGDSVFLEVIGSLGFEFLGDTGHDGNDVDFLGVDSFFLGIVGFNED